MTADDLPTEDLPTGDLPPPPASATDARFPAPAPVNGQDGLHHLDPRHVAHGRLAGAVVTAVIAFALALGVLIVMVAADGLATGGRLLVAGAALAVVAGVALLSWRWPVVEHAHVRYGWGDEGLEIRRGVWWRREIHVPRSRIQHTDVSQGPLERRFGLATLHVFTAGTENAEVTLGGLDLGTATAIRDHLLAGTGDDVL